MPESSSASLRHRTATQWGVYDVEVSNGKINGIKGIEIDPHPSALTRFSTRYSAGLARQPKRPPDDPPRGR